jgi:hypothetical protein
MTIPAELVDLQSRASHRAPGGEDGEQWTCAGKIAEV